MCSSVVPPGPQVLTNTPLESAAQSKEGHLSQRMLEHYSHVRMDAKRRALDALSQGGHGTKRGTLAAEPTINPVADTTPTNVFNDLRGHGEQEQARDNIISH